MIRHEDVKKALKSDFAEKVTPTKAKRVLVVLPKGIVGEEVEYKDWNGNDAKGCGFLFDNDTDNRIQFLKADGGIIIGYEGECPEGEDGKMISRSEAVANYLKNNPNAFKDKDNILKTLDYFEMKIFKHGSDVSEWDENAKPDMWTSNVNWLINNFYNEDVFDEKGNVRTVISATKKTAIYDAIYFGPNIVVEGIGTTCNNGSWVMDQHGRYNLITDDAFKCAYKKIKKPQKTKKISTQTIENITKATQPSL